MEISSASCGPVVYTISNDRRHAQFGVLCDKIWPKEVLTHQWDPWKVNFHKRPQNEIWIAPLCSSRRGDQFSYITLCQQRSYAEDITPRTLHKKTKKWAPLGHVAAPRAATRPF